MRSNPASHARARACPGPRGRSRPRTRRSCRRRRAGPAADSSSTRVASARRNCAIVGDEHQRALVVGERAHERALGRRCRGGWSARRAPAGWARRRAAWPARRGPSRRPRARAPACRRRRRGSRRRRPGCAACPGSRSARGPRSSSSTVRSAVEAVHQRAGRSSPSSPTRRSWPRRHPGAQHAGHHLEQRRLAGAVLAHDRPALAAARRSGRGRRGPRACRRPCARASSLTTSSPERGGVRKSKRRSTMRRGGSATFSILSSFFIRLWTCAALAAWALKRSMNRLSLASIACWRAYSASRRAASIDARLLVEVVVAAVGADLAAVDLDDLADDAVHDVAVVAGHHHRARVVAQEAPRATGSTRCRGSWSARRAAGSRAREQDLRERDAHLPAARQRADVVGDLLVGEAEAGQDRLRPRLELVAAEVLVAGLDLAEALDDVVEVVAGASAMAPSARASSSPSSATSPAPAHGLGQDAAARAGRRRPGGSSRCVSLRGRSMTPSSGCSSPAIRRKMVLLPAPLGPTSPTFSPGLIWKRGVDEQDLAAVLLGDAGERDHGSVRATCRCRSCLASGGSASNAFTKGWSAAVPGARPGPGGQVAPRTDALGHVRAARSLWTHARVTAAEVEVVLVEAEVTAAEVEVVLVEAEVTAAGVEVVLVEAEVTAAEVEVVLVEAEVTASGVEVVLIEAEVTASGVEVVLVEAEVTASGVEVVLVEAEVTASGVEVVLVEAGVVPAEGEVLHCDTAVGLRAPTTAGPAARLSERHGGLLRHTDHVLV